MNSNIIDNFKNFILQVKNKYIYLYITIIVSFIISLLSFLSTFITLHEINLKFLILFLPFLCVLLITFITYKISDTFPKYRKFTIILAKIINTLIILLYLVLSTFMILFNYSMQMIKYEHPSQYSQALNAISFSENITHFPHKIPYNAKHVKLNMYKNNWFGSEQIVLRFVIDKKYIYNELRKYNFISIENYEDQKHTFSYLDIPTKELEKYKFYIIGDRESDKPEEHMFFYFYGIAVNDNNIIYFYVCPD